LSIGQAVIIGIGVPSVQGIFVGRLVDVWLIGYLLLVREPDVRSDFTVERREVHTSVVS
jgi:hypothetical protein